MAAPGYDLYYLNVMAGPGERAWRVSDDPAHAWLKSTWVGEPWILGCRSGVRRRGGPGEQHPADGRAGGGPLPGRAADRARRERHRLIEGCFGIFGHGNVAGLGEALLEAELATPARRLLPGAERAGDGPRRGGLRADARPAVDARLYDVDRARAPRT